MTVSGLTMISASRQSFQSLERQTQKRRSRRRSFGRLTVRLRTRSCCRRTRISVASDILETNRDRKNRKSAEKMAIRVEGSRSGEGDGRWNRIAASSARCKGNKATGHWRKLAAETRYFRGLFRFFCQAIRILSLRLNRVTRSFGSFHHQDPINIGENALCARFPQKLAFSRQAGKYLEVLQFV